jgi:hypothetical protein
MSKKLVNAVIMVMLIMSLSLLAFGVYTPAPTPMGDYTIRKGVVFEDVFYIVDPNGPEGITVICEPDGLVISTPTIQSIEGDAEKRLYSFPYTFTATSPGTYVFRIIATDTEGIVAEQQIKIVVKGNAPHIFTGCRGMGYVPPAVVSLAPPTMGQLLAYWDKTTKENTRASLVFHYNKVVEGKQGLSPKYENLDELKNLIARYDDPQETTNLGWLINK